MNKPFHLPKLPNLAVLSILACLFKFSLLNKDWHTLYVRKYLNETNVWRYIRQLTF